MLEQLRRELTALAHPLAGCALQPMSDKGLAHDHVRLAGSGWLARIPKQSQMGLAAVRNLDYQRTCFERAAPGGHSPALHGVLAPSANLPRGALLVAEIEGRAARLPGDLGAIVRALGSLHALPLPPRAKRSPLQDERDPLKSLCDEIAAQARFLAGAKVAPEVAGAIESQQQRLQALCDQAARPRRHLIAFDGHPGNFIVRADGSAVLVDLEKCRYSYPGLDLAHATLYTSTTWDVDSHAVLSEGEIMAAYRAWDRFMGAAAGEAARWHVPLRGAMWLWSITWCAKWRVLSREREGPSGDGEDWSADRSEAALVTHVRGRVEHYLSAPVVARVLHELAMLERVLSP
ncbi:hypothetical protein LPB072_18755 [Hydrogenophaga crassostreae]|uniref:Aminoglycoside phosphotransferase n=1 Tax=Hydrogenophaga crassostreae TaxID=1763535 RepID=A0A1D8P377_9BURK|nr:hypothetical protein LPB072_18755 [Hydrogenophaga crassostreae]